MSSRLVVCALNALLGIGSLLPAYAATTTADPITIRFDRLSPKEGLTLSVTAPGDRDGETTFSNESCCGIENAQTYIRDVRAQVSGRPVTVERTPAGWKITHKPDQAVTVTYRLPPSGPMQMDAGTPGQFRPLVRTGLLHLIGTTALLLPVGRSGSDPVQLAIDATRVADDDHFVSSFGAGAYLRNIRSTRRQITSALYLGGAIALSLHDTPKGKVAVAYSGMLPTLRADELRSDALAIVAAERGFFDDGQPWYLVSVHGGVRNGSPITLGGGTGLTNSFAMFVAEDLDFSNPEHREQFRWVLAHEYFHQWNGLTLRVASRPGSDEDDTSVYWFSEGVTEFYTMRLLTRAGLQSPSRSLDILNNKFMRYGTNSKRTASAEAAGHLFWTDRDGEQIPYLRGYLAAWYADLAAKRSEGGNQGMDASIKVLVARAKAEPSFRLGNAFLADFLGRGLLPQDADALRTFVVEGGEAPLDTGSFLPCLKGQRQVVAGQSVLQFDFSNSDSGCFQH